MATPSSEKTHTFRRFEDGDSEHPGWDEYIFQASWTHKCPTYINKTPPCQGSCPSGHDIRGWLQIVRGIEKPTGDAEWEKYAFDRAVSANPFPSMMGRVCPAPCEDGCNRNQVEDHVGINAVEQYIGDTALEKGYTLGAPGAETGKKIAIIGGGPAGLAAAFQLRRLGHGCTVFDDHEELGGMMRYGIPSYRTPRDVLDGEIKRIIDMGVETKLKTRVGKDIPMADVEKEFDAIIWALGAKKGRPLPCPGSDAPNCLSGVGFLEAFNEKRLQVVSKKVVVVGGGDTSIDVVSVARRLGHITDIHDKDRPENVVMGFTAHDVASTVVREGSKVTLTSLFPIENMTAAEHEVEDALREGVDIKGSVMPLEVLLDSEGRATGLRCAKCKIEGNRPVAIEGTEFTIDADIVVSAIGQSGDLTGLESMDNGHGFIGADKFYQVPDKPGHFLAGDIVRPHLLTTAIGQAAIAVQSVDQYLNKTSELKKRPKVDVLHFDLLDKLTEWDLSPEDYGHGTDRGTSEENYAVHNYDDRSAAEIIPHDDLFLGHFEEVARYKRENIEISSEAVLGNFQERLVGYTEESAVAEAGRCMSCGMCFECDNCVLYCPQDAVSRTPKAESTTGRYVYTDYSKCIGCHICAEVCPTGYINMGLGE